MMQRFFIPPEWIDNSKVTLIDEVAHQLRNVLRVQPGDQIMVLDDLGQEYQVILTHIAKNVVVGEVLQARPADNEPAIKLTLYQGTLKAQKFEWVLQKGTELGISEFVPVISERSVLSDVDIPDHKSLRWEKIIQEAAEQSGRGLLPELRPAMMFPQACRRAAAIKSLALLGWIDAEAPGLKGILTEQPALPERINLFVGSEGGFTLDEARLASRYNIQPVWFGKRVLRAETAGLAVSAAIFYHFGEMG